MLALDYCFRAFVGNKSQDAMCDGTLQLEAFRELDPH